MTLFVPGAVMKQENVVVLLELIGRQKSDSKIQFLDNPIMKYSDDDDEFSDPHLSGYLRFSSIFFFVKWNLFSRRYAVASALRRHRLHHKRNSAGHINAFSEAKKYFDFFKF